MNSFKVLRLHAQSPCDVFTTGLTEFISPELDITIGDFTLECTIGGGDLSYVLKVLHMLSWLLVFHVLIVIAGSLQYSGCVKLIYFCLCIMGFSCT